MDQRKRNIRLLFILGVLVLASIALHFIPENSRSTLENATFFQISDTAAIDKITMQSEQLDNTLVRTDSGWVINEKIKADENIMRVLLAVMKQVEILRPIPPTQAEEMQSSFSKQAIEVRFYTGDGLIKAFEAGANDTQTLSIFKSSEEKYYVVNLPGYSSFVTGIFKISEIDWKDRLIVDAAPTRLNDLNVHYFENENNSFKVEVEGNMPFIPGIDNLDTLKLMDYLDQFRYFQADQYVDVAQESIYDSLLKTPPYAGFFFDNMGDGLVTITFYNKIPGENMILGVTGNGEYALFNYKRIAGIFRVKKYFVKKE